MNWHILRSYHVHLEWTRAGWAVMLTTDGVNRIQAGTISRGMLAGYDPDPSPLFVSLCELATAMEPITRPVTVHNLAESTAQQVFDYVSMRLLLQGRSTDEGDLYGRETGLRSAAGWLIPEETYRPWMELIGLYDLLAEEWTDFHSLLIEELEGIHNEVPVGLWETELHELAQREDLNPWPRLVDPDERVTGDVRRILVGSGLPLSDDRVTMAADAITRYITEGGRHGS